jgi:hypothetical protein
MWIELSELTIALATAAFGGGRLLGQFRNINTVKDLRDGLKGITGKKAFLSNAPETEVVLDFLNYSELIMRPLRSRLIRRLLLLLGCVLASAPIPLVLADQRVMTNEIAAWAIRIGVAVFQVGSGVLTGKFFRPEESEFLNNSASLHERFYDLYVLPAIHVFNNGVRASEVLGPVRDAGRAASSMIPNYLNHIVKGSLNLQKKQEPGL